MENKDLKNYYDKIYKEGKRGDHFLKYRDGIDIPLDHKIAYEWLFREGFDSDASALDFGCGEGEFLQKLKCKERLGIDYSEIALDNARENDPKVEFLLGNERDLHSLGRSFDAITSFGVLEHVDEPEQVLRALVKLCKTDGVLIISCPSFINIRGVIWMTLQLLFDVPMSLSDKHFLTPTDIKVFLKGTGKSIVEMLSVDNDVTQGDYFSKDMTRRLTNALSDAELPNDKVKKLIDWVDRNKQYFDTNDMTGSNMLYLIK